ncbi:MAG: SprB repeat-containing protein, partial [Saprospiraceae bacterium]
TVKDPASTGTSGAYSLSNALILWGSHSAGTPPYTYRLPASPVAQFMGILDAATQNGSEQIYMPRQGTAPGAPSTFDASAVARWNPGANVIVFDPSQINVTNPNLTDFRNVAATVVYGRGFDDPNNGWVMYEAGHSHNKATAPDNIAAQRAFFNFSLLMSLDQVVLPDLSVIPSAISSGTPVELGYTLPAGANPSDFIPQWSSTCGGTFTPSANDNPTTFTPPVVSNPTSCIINISITDLCGRTFNESKIVTVNPCVLTVNRTVTPPSCFGGSNGQIAMSISGAPAPYSWNWSRVSPAGTGSGTGTTISGLSAGTYNVTVTAGPTCSAKFTQLVTQPNQLVASATPVNYACFGQTGAINLTVNGGTSPYTYDWADLMPPTDPEPQNRADLPAGTYTVTVTDANNCTATTSATVTGPSEALAVVLDSKTDATCSGVQDGAINITASGGTPAYSYLWSDGNTGSDRSGLGAGAYNLTVTDSKGCTATLMVTIAQPATLVLTLGKVDPTCPVGATPATLGGDGSIDLTVTGGTTPYIYDWADLTSPPAEPEDRSSLPAGTYSVTVTDSKGCTGSISATLTPLNPLPSAPSGINNN